MIPWQNRAVLPTLLAVVLAACAQETYPAALLGTGASSDPSGSTVAAASAGPMGCSQARAQSLPARLVAISAQSGSAPESVSDDTLFATFSSVGLCGACHGLGVAPPGQGGFQIRSVEEFRTKMTPAVLSHVESNQLTAAPTADDDPMPPPGSANGGPYAQRSETDPIKQWAELVAEWLAAGSPEVFLPSGGSDAGAVEAGVSSTFSMTPALGDALTNIGNCIPGAGMVATESARSSALDAMFAASTANADTTLSGQEQLGLPSQLSQTDLFTFDSQTLAQYGVISYAPGYPLWSDNAGQMRHVRVPRGTSIHFDKETQQFDIPPNTRFYKTFLKEIVDTDNSIRWRKIETRLIVSRPDEVDANGNHTPAALFGTYQWADDESEAYLIDSKRNDLTPFPDTLLTYNTDEPLAAYVLATSDPATVEQSQLAAGAVRHYAIPGSERCHECHMGSPSAAFVLGFTPLQIARRPTGEGGVIESAGPDELTQLQRLIDYGVVTGLNRPTDVLPLEASQGGRAPRNPEELVAQGYMLGNCAHCHNPIGYPTVQNPVLKDVLDFLPGPSGGIFQFPLERYSPRIFRGANGTNPIPYITPSLMDLPEPYDANTSALFATGGGNGTDFGTDVTATSVVYAPWRSLIYRNVDSAFTYADDYTIFPHMPFNTPGYDPRVKQILSDWMVSIPATRKHPETFEYSFYNGPDQSVTGSVDATPQPYVEVLPGAPGYDVAAAAAQQRLAILHTGINPALPSPSVIYSRYDDPDDTSDIIDPQVTADPVCHPVPTPQHLLGEIYPLARHPDWVVTDLTNPATYALRRPDWNQILVDLLPPLVGLDCPGASGAAQANVDQEVAVGLLQNIQLDSAIRAFATTPVPFGLWEKQSGCNFATAATEDPVAAWWLAAPPAGSYAAPEPIGDRPPWMDVVKASADAPVYLERPGQAVFKMICINCHGPLADANGRFSQNLANITGGRAHVADFRDGLFGPLATPETNIDQQFGSISLPDGGPVQAATAAEPDGGAPPQWAGISDDDIAARYMAWMALGGTSVTIPLEILGLVATTPVLGQARTTPPAVTSANMLSTAKELCLGFLGDPAFAGNGTMGPAFTGRYLEPGVSDPTHPAFNRQLITNNYDAELWLRLCTLNNPPPVHVVQITNPNVLHGPYIRQFTDDPASLHAAAFAENYPPNTLIGNDQGATETTLAGNCGPGTGQSCISPTNLWPWCVDVSSLTAAVTDTTAAALQAYASSLNLPMCPDALQQPAHWWMAESDGNVWAVRGAVNAGLSVFLYLQWLETQSSPPPDYDQCTQLPQP